MAGTFPLEPRRPTPIAKRVDMKPWTHHSEKCCSRQVQALRSPSFRNSRCRQGDVPIRLMEHFQSGTGEHYIALGHEQCCVSNAVTSGVSRSRSDSPSVRGERQTHRFGQLSEA